MQKRTPFNVISFLKTPYGLMISEKPVSFPQMWHKLLSLQHIKNSA